MLSKLLENLVGAGRFERPTPCAQGSGTPKYFYSVSPFNSIAHAEIIYTAKNAA
jgi:hypothetical protein